MIRRKIPQVKKQSTNFQSHKNISRRPSKENIRVNGEMAKSLTQRPQSLGEVNAAWRTQSTISFHSIDRSGIQTYLNRHEQQERGFS
jgi:hypothetical protein